MPLGPGFHFASRQASIRQVAAGSLRVHVRVTDQLTNGGTRALGYLDILLPEDVSEGTGLSILADGHQVHALLIAREPGAPLRIHFEPSWPQGETKSFAFDYELAPTPGSTVVAAAPDAFYLADSDALPRWLPPAGFFVTADSQARREDFEVTAPIAFRVLAAGREQRPKRQGDLAIHSFRLSNSDFPPFVVAGRYQETPIHTDRGDVIFWTLHPLNAQSAQSSAERLAGTAATYEKAFGPASKKRSPIRIVEVPSAASSDEDDAAPFTNGAVLSERVFATGIADDSVLELAESALARTWFGWVAQPSPRDQVLLGRAAGLFAVVMAAKARGGDTARRAAIGRLLAAYDRDQASENIAIIPGAPLSHGYKAALFWVALEDLSGAEPLQRATRHLLQALAGKEISAVDLRSALESETGRDLVEVFHTWIDHSGLPADFRARYATRP